MMTGWSNLAVDLVDTTSNMIDAAAAVVTGRLHLDSPRDVRARLLSGDALAISYFRFELSRQIASALLTMDPYVIAVYEEQDVPESEDVTPVEASFAEPLKLFVEVACKTPVLPAVIDALNEALSQAIGGLLPEPPRGYIEAIVVDEDNRRLLRPRAYGYHPAPILLAAREDTDKPETE
ncbi:MAG TPA: hypothetical protein DEU95_13215 [Chloroflexi bacterium]|nr:hypothetical protein [Chloroflexota bacterium]HBY46442.1 hypothetical protein [Chloroflexota bacterium]HCG30645.1 hypothetical protein [Chloroflexota bacterium]